MITKYNDYIKESNAKDSKVIDSYFLQTYEETKAWLDSMNIDFYTINKDLTVDVNGIVNIIYKNLTKIPVQFNIVYSVFYCSNNQLTSLKGCPKIVHCDFLCNNNPLEDITDLDSSILIKSIKDNNLWTRQISTEVWDNYFEHWISKDINIVSALKDKVSNTIKEKYKHLFNANNFDLL